MIMSIRVLDKIISNLDFHITFVSQIWDAYIYYEVRFEVTIYLKILENVNNIKRHNGILFCSVIYFCLIIIALLHLF